MKWFKHNTNASEREFLAELEDKFGLEGYARWFKLLEKIGANMGGENGCSVALPWTDWQRFLKGKRNKLETFLVHLENKTRINRKQNGNIMEIECPNMLKIRDDYSKKSVQSPEKVAPRVRSKSKELDIDTNKKKKNKKKTPPPPRIEKEILKYLNEKASKNFKSVEENLTPIKARLSAGFSERDCLRVIDNRVGYWKFDPEMNQYLRPGTVFRKSKFESYLNAEPYQEKKTNSGPRIFSPEHEAEMQRISDEAEAEEKANE